VGSRQVDGVPRASLERVDWAERLSERPEILVLLRRVVHQSFECRR
jgi:hypothetical protein